MNCPRQFAAYRDSTWRIISTLATPKQDGKQVPKEYLESYSALQPYIRTRLSKFCLASSQKSFLGTHYRDAGLPVRLQDICVPNGLKLRYFDSRYNIWSDENSQKRSFSHHCSLVLPPNSGLSHLQISPSFSGDANGPSSYEIISSQTKCPNGLSIHEYLSFQTLFSGKARRWHQILIELGSSTINFGTEATTTLLNFLSLQIGPAENSDPLGVVHSVFRDQLFCSRLLEQIDQRLDAISVNWREVNCMETLITLALRLFEIGCIERDKAAGLLVKARVVTSNWMAALRLEIQTATDEETSRRWSGYAFWAALLCRRTYSLNVGQSVQLDAAALQCFLACSITLQDNLITNPNELQPALKRAFIRDLNLVHQMRSLLWSSLERSQCSLLAAINTIWPNMGGGSSTCSSFRILTQADDGWVEMIVEATESTTEYAIHFHLLEGHLLIMGKPVGKLPDQWRSAGVLVQLFGNRSLHTYPSNIPGKHSLPLSWICLLDASDDVDKQLCNLTHNSMF